MPAAGDAADARDASAGTDEEVEDVEDPQPTKSHALTTATNLATRLETRRSTTVTATLAPAVCDVARCHLHTRSREALRYSTVMLSARDLQDRWPALNVAARSARLPDTLRLAWGPLAPRAAHTADLAERATMGLWRGAPETWSDDPAVHPAIANRLGWRQAPEWVAGELDRVRAFADAARRDGFTDCVLLGMGGSSLAAEVLRTVLGTVPEWLRFHVLDSTDPAAVRAVTAPPRQTLYLLASKSGSTVEPNAMAAHFAQGLRDADVIDWGTHFVAITDAGTELEARASREHFRGCFVNPADIGGRYSALSLFGMVPAALMGQDLSALAGWGAGMMIAAQAGGQASAANPAAGLGLFMALNALNGRDKLTLLLPPSLAPFALWVEQLVAESLGKNGVGVVPVAGESLGSPEDYGNDRAFVRVRVHGTFAEEDRDPAVNTLRAAGHPVAEIDLLEPAALGAEFARWEVATAVAGAILRVNPFDEPDVTRAKTATSQLLDRYRTTGRLPEGDVDTVHPSGVALTLSRQARGLLSGHDPAGFLKLCGPADYVAVLAYVPVRQEWDDAIDMFRRAFQRQLRRASTFGYGPRYLHSTGQLHKGGPNTGLFLMVTATPKTDLAIPGNDCSFGVLERAQALGDFASLDTLERRVLLLHLPTPDPNLLSAALRDLLDRVRVTLG